MSSGERWATFDCYGTLVDWLAGMRAAFATVAPGQVEPLLAAYHRHEPRVEAETPAARYREILAETARRAAAEVGVGLEDGDLLGRALPGWPVFADVGPALGALRERGWRLALLTNCDDDLVAGTLRRLPVPIDAVVTAQQVGAYKPARAHFDRFAELHGAAAERWVHAAQSWFHDVRPGAALGLPCVWVNRLGDHDDPTLAAAVLPDLRELPATVERVAR